MSGTIHWYKNASFDKPNLNSPQPCPHGAGCDYKRKNPEGELVPASCRGVHPGEEGTGRRLFPSRRIEAKDGTFINQAFRGVSGVRRTTSHTRRMRQMSFTSL